MRKGQHVTHKVYGKAIVDSVWPSAEHSKGGVTLTLLTKEGKAKFADNRKGDLPRCFENDLKKVK